MARCPSCKARISFRQFLSRTNGVTAFVHCPGCGKALKIYEPLVFLFAWAGLGVLFGYWLDANLAPTLRIALALVWIVGFLPVGYLEYLLIAQARERRRNNAL